MDATQIKRWKATEVVLKRARAALPTPTLAVHAQFEASIAQFREYVSHNELGLAFDELCVAAQLVNCRGSVWRDLERAAEFMNLSDRAREMRERFLNAPVYEI
jgi:hypothetical protein